MKTSPRELGTGCRDLAPCRSSAPPSPSSIAFLRRPLAAFSHRDAAVPALPRRRCCGGMAVGHPRSGRRGTARSRGGGRCPSSGVGVRRQGRPRSAPPAGNGRGPPDPALSRRTHLSRWRRARAAEKSPSLSLAFASSINLISSTFLVFLQFFFSALTEELELL